MIGSLERSAPVPFQSGAEQCLWLEVHERPGCRALALRARRQRVQGAARAGAVADVVAHPGGRVLCIVPHVEDVR